MNGPGQDAEDKRARLARLLHEARRRQRVDDPPLAVVAADADGLPRDPSGLAVAPATPAQQALWLLDGLPGTDSAYVVALSAELDGPLHVGALRDALDALAQRHDALRARFETSGESLRMHVDARAVIPLDTVSLDEAPVDSAAREDPDREAPADAEAEHGIEERARTLARAFVETRFDLRKAPLARAQLLRLGSRRHRLTLAVHHIVCDGWSVGLIARDLGELYRARLESRAPVLPTIEASYARYAAWQCERTSDARLAGSIAHWRGRLAGLAPLGLPTDRPRSARPDRTCDRVNWRIGPVTTAALRTLAGAEGATPYMALLAVFQVLLARHSGRSDIAVGTPIAGRDRSDLEAMVGYFVNMLVMRTDLAGEPSFRDLVTRVRDTTLDAFEHAQVPFDRLVAALAPVREPGVNPLFQVSFALHNIAERPLELAGLACDSTRLRPGTTRFDLSLAMTEREGGLDAELEFATALFDRERIERMAGHLDRLLAAVIADPSCPIGDLPMIGPEESGLLERWNATTAPYPRQETLIGLFEAQVRRGPGAIAVHAGESVLDYATLDRRANRLAHHLRELGADRGCRVALCLERGADMLVALLATLKAGAAFVPLDPREPAMRRNEVIEDALPTVLVVHSTTLAGLRLPAGARLLVIDAEAASVAACPDERPVRDTGPADLAYVLYTSGSTGRPKGVMVEHGSLVNHVFWCIDAFGLTARDAMLQRSTIAFDGSGVELWPTLVAGARLVIADEDQARDPHALLALVRRHEVSVAKFMPGLLVPLLEELARDPRPLPLRTVLVAGDVLAPGDARRWIETTGTELLNLYGPTECTIDATWHRVESVDDDRSVPIGRPIHNCRIHILDSRLRQVPIGVVGEICIAGVGLARGYLGRPELDAERFVPNPFEEPGARLYRSGDAGRWGPDGSIEFIGRIDRQIKIRGHRIEPGEVEAALLAAGARAAVVQAEPDRNGDERLVAYVEPAGLEAAALRASLAARLPAWMLPARTFMLDRLPLLANGKLDRKAIGSIDLRGHEAHQAEIAQHPAPRQGERASGNATRIAAIWSGLLGIEVVGADDDFFELGGHSLLAARAAVRISAEFGVEVPVSALFDAPTPRGLAMSITGEASKAAGTGAIVDSAAASGTQATPACVSTADTPCLAASPQQQSLWYIESAGGAPGAYHVPLAWRIEGDIDSIVLHEALGYLVQRHEALRSRFEARSGELRQRIDPEVDIPLETIATRGDPRDAAQEFVSRRFDLAGAPAWRVALVEGDGERWLVLVMHHIVTDGWSMAILQRELGAAYAALSRGEAPSLPPLPASTADYLRQQQAAPAMAARERALAYWRDRLAGVEPIALPTDRRRPHRHAGQATRLPVTIERSVLASARELARREGASLYMVLLAAWQAVLSRHSGQSGFAVGTPTAGRHAAEFEPLVGYFVNMLAMRADLSGDPSFADLLGRVRRDTLAALDHSQISFDRLVAELAPRRDAGVNPLFQVAFALQNAPAGTLEIPGVRCSNATLAPGESKFDLFLSLAECSDSIEGTLEYPPALFDADRIERLAGHFTRLLAAAVADPDRSIAELPLADAEEIGTLARWSQGLRNPYPADASLAALFEAKAREHPDAVAIESVAGRLTYRDLDARADKLARALGARGIGNGSLVGLALARGEALVVAMLGIMKAGAAYLPLDPAYPAERLAAMASDARPALLISDRESSARFAQLDDIPSLRIDRDATDTASYPTSAPRSGADGSSLAYVMYTSGSTGLPKGVQVPQRAISRLVLETDYIRLGSDDVVAQASNTSFDAATFEIWGALLNGSTLVPLSPETVLDRRRLAAAIRERGITVLFLTTSLFNAHAAAEPGMFGPLHCLIIGGEAADPAILLQVAESASPPHRMVNGYGPTETTTFATAWEIPLDAASLARETELGVPIGRPIANTSCHVLDGKGQLQPVGVVGELCIGGPGVAQGYLGRADATRERFVPAPGDEDGPTWYRTGDLVRWRQDGTLLYCGRNDRQVKIRGFRIEPGEIEAVMRSLAGVRNAAAVVDDNPQRDARIVGFVVPDGRFDEQSLRRAIGEKLPAYMVPAALLPLDALPITDNGKLDRTALVALLREGQASLAPLDSPSSQPAAETAPLDEDATRLLALWRRILARPDLDADEHFFEAGGHSLLALRMLAEVEREFDVEPRVAALFDAPTVRLFAALLRDRRSNADTGCAVTIQTGGAAAPLFFVSGYGGEIVMFRDLAHALGPGQALVVLDTAAFRAEELAGLALPDVATRMIADLRKIQPHGPYHLCGYSLGGKFVYEIARQLRASGEEVALLALLDCNAPGYPKRRRLAGRLAVHADRILAQGMAENIRYLREQFGWLAKGFRKRDLFEYAPELAESRIARSMKDSAEAMFQIWRQHHPGRYEGSLLVVRAAIRSERASVIDDDPMLGWATWVDGPVTVRDLRADHLSMLRPVHAAALAETLAEFLEAPSHALANALPTAGAGQAPDRPDSPQERVEPERKRRAIAG